MACIALIMGDRERNAASGRFTEEYPRETFVRALRANDGTAGTTDIAEHVGCDRRTAYNKLNEMADDGVITRQKIGNSLVWSLAESGEQEDRDR
jgi:Mn-dependent DtxR family transcriptional regulator